VTCGWHKDRLKDTGEYSPGNRNTHENTNGTSCNLGDDVESILLSCV